MAFSVAKSAASPVSQRFAAEHSLHRVRLLRPLPPRRLSRSMLLPTVQALHMWYTLSSEPSACQYSVAMLARWHARVAMSSESAYPRARPLAGPV